MAVPEQVRKQTEAVQQLYKDLEEPVPASPENGEAAPVPKEVLPAPAGTLDSVDGVAPPPEPTEPGDGSQAETFENKYKTLQGMYNADVPRLKAQNDELSQRLEQMEQLIVTMQAAPAPTPAPIPKPESLLSAEEMDEYGESIDIMRKVSQEVAGVYEQRLIDMQTTIDQLKGTVMPRVEAIASTQAHSIEQAFWSDLSSAVPNWREINGDPGFQSWLLEVDALSNLSRQTYLDDAQRNMDAGRVASFFSSWQQANGTVPAQPNRTASNSELEKQVTPGKGRNTGTTPGGEQKTYTPKDITNFFNDVRLGKYKGKEEERDKTERDIFAAQRDGRIVQA